MNSKVSTRLHLVRKILNLWGTEKSKNVKFSLKYKCFWGIFGKLGVGTFLMRCNLLPDCKSENGNDNCFFFYNNELGFKITNGRKISKFFEKFVEKSNYTWKTQGKKFRKRLKRNSKFFDDWWFLTPNSTSWYYKEVY